MFHVKNVRFSYPGQKEMIFPDISLASGESLLILGKSGSGKTTFLNLMTGLLAPKTGEILLDGSAIQTQTGVEADRFRGKNIGIVFQKPHLLAPLTVKENIGIANYFSGKSGTDPDSLLRDLGLSHKANALISYLSEGEAQRVSIARALITQPRLIVADEPTSSLDDENAHQVIQLLLRQAQKINAILIIVTHDQRVKDQIPNSLEVSTAL